ncbi:MAG: hypothetical protein AAB855_00480 [Patescibacteria group bacterium]
MKCNFSFVIGCILGLTVFALLNVLTVGSQSQSPSAYSGDTRTLSEQTKSEAQVSITVTPTRSDVWRFAISLETPSVELSQALDEVSILTDDRGREYAPTSWEGDPPGGHHRSGTLLFTGINPSVKTLTLDVRTIGGVPDRFFTWELGKK